MNSFAQTKLAYLALAMALFCPMGSLAVAQTGSTMAVNPGIMDLTGSTVFRAPTQRPSFIWNGHTRRPRRISIPNQASGLSTVTGTSLTIQNPSQGSATLTAGGSLTLNASATTWNTNAPITFPNPSSVASTQASNLTFLTSNTLSVLNLNGGLLGSPTSTITNSSIRIGTTQTFSFSNHLSPPSAFTGGVLTIGGGTINFAYPISASSIQITGNCGIGFSVAPAAPINIEAAINAADSGTAFVNGNAADASTPTGAVFPTGTTIKVISLTSATAICTITNNSGSDLNIKPSTTINGGIAISKP